MKLIDISGKKFNRLLVLEKCENSRKWKCLCDCGNITFVDSRYIRHGSTKSCGCYRKSSGEMHRGWKGGKHFNKSGYVMTMCKGHPAATIKGFVMEHRLVAEKALGKYLDATHPVHHINGDKTDNRPENLVICESHSYHALLHKRMREMRVR